MGTRGPIPKRSEQRRRNNSPASDNGTARGVDYTPPPADERWHEVAKKLYNGACNSGQAYWYEESDWAILWTLCESISRDLKPKVVYVDPETGEKHRATQPIRGSSLNAYTRVMQDLMMTEAARRRSRIELVRGNSGSEDDGRSAAILDLRDRLRG